MVGVLGRDVVRKLLMRQVRVLLVRMVTLLVVGVLVVFNMRVRRPVAVVLVLLLTIHRGGLCE